MGMRVHYCDLIEFTTARYPIMAVNASGPEPCIFVVQAPETKRNEASIKWACGKELVLLDYADEYGGYVIQYAPGYLPVDRKQRNDL